MSTMSGTGRAAVASVERAARPAFAADLLRTARPRQWIKNAFVLAPLIFSGRFREAEWILLASLAAAAFTMTSAATYFLNDIFDRRFDRVHPIKRSRPIASGRISPALALVCAAAAVSAGLGAGALVNASTIACLAAYAVLQTAYTTVLKRQALIDVLCIALGFVLRVIAGSAAIEVEPSAWLLVCTLFLATFLGFAKRSGEVVRMGAGGEGPGGSRPVLIMYHDRLLDALLSITASLTLLSYALYTVERRPYSPVLLSTIPVVAYALFRYLLLALRADQEPAAESPETLLLRDRGLILAGLIWGAMCVTAMWSLG